MRMECIRIKVLSIRMMISMMVILLPYSCQPEEEGPFIEVETGAIDKIGPTFCTATGEILELGMDGILQHGFVWSVSPGPSLETGEVSKRGMTSTTGTYSNIIRGLLPNTLYYVRAYGSDEARVAYGTEKTFTTLPPSKPAVHTVIAYDIDSNVARSGGFFDHDGGSEITSKGVCWSMLPKPTIDDNHTIDGIGSEGFDSRMEELEPYSVYFYRAYATNGIGTTYAEQFALITLWDNSPISDVDGNEYATIQIGEQVWTAENLRVLNYSDGSPLPFVSAEEAWAGLSSDSRAYCLYDNSDEAYGVYGALYNWAAAMNGEPPVNDEISSVQGVCPAGWHLPSDEEWKMLEISMGMSELRVGKDGWRGWDEGGKLKQTGTALWADPNEFATNESGFGAIPGGFRDSTGVFISGGSFTGFWSTRGGENNAAWIRGLHANRGEILRELVPRKGGYSVRCIMDDY